MREDGNPQAQVDVAERTGIVNAEGKPGAVDARLQNAQVTSPDVGRVGTTPDLLTNWKVATPDADGDPTKPSQQTIDAMEGQVAPANQTQAESQQSDVALASGEQPAATPEKPAPTPAEQFRTVKRKYEAQTAAVGGNISDVLLALTAQNENGDSNKLSDLSAVDRAALLQIAEDQLLANPQDGQVSLTVDRLRAEVLSETDATEVYFTEHYREMDATQISAEMEQIAQTPDTLKKCPGAQLRMLREAVHNNQAAYDMLAVESPKTGEAIKALEQQWQVREQTVAAATETFISLESDTDAVAQVADLPPNAIIANVVNDGTTVTTTFVDPETGTKTEVKAKEINIWAMVAIMALSDSLLGTNNLSSLVDIWARHNIYGPLLERMGADPSSLYEQFGKEKYAAMDGMIKTLNASSNGSDQANKFFADTLNNRTTFQILEQTNPIHLKKIFAAGGPQRFGSIDGGFLSFAGDNLQLDSDLVEKMLASLSDHEKERLSIGKPPAQPPAPQQTPAPQGQPQAAPTT